MPSSLKNDLQIWKLAKDLGLKPREDPLAQILDHCRDRIRSFLREFPCDSLSDLLENAATHLETIFVEVKTNEDLRELRNHYFNRGEKAFAILEDELGPDVLAITFRRMRP